MGPESQETSKATLPIIDFSKWTSPDSSTSRLAMAKELVEACHETGFVYLTNHGISPELLDEIFAMSKSFYDLPLEKKMEAKHPEGLMAFRGYSWPGHEKPLTLYTGSENTGSGETGQDIDVEVIDLTESYAMGSDKHHEEPNVWLPPTTLPNFRSITTKFYWECWKVSQNLLRALALGLGFDDEEFLLQFHSGHDNELSLRHYPSVEASALLKDNMKRLNAHTDFDSFTLLFQDDCGGLEVQRSGCPGEFVHVDPIKYALVMNIGDALMRWSNDYLTSTIHRVHLPPLQDRYTGEQRVTRERYSIPYFVSPRGETVMECLPACHSETNPPKYEPMLFRDYFKERVSQIFQAKV